MTFWKMRTFFGLGVGAAVGCAILSPLHADVGAPATGDAAALAPGGIKCTLAKVTVVSQSGRGPGVRGETQRNALFTWFRVELAVQVPADLTVAPPTDGLGLRAASLTVLRDEKDTDLLRGAPQGARLPGMLYLRVPAMGGSGFPSVVPALVFETRSFPMAEIVLGLAPGTRSMGLGRIEGHVDVPLASESKTVTIDPLRGRLEQSVDLGHGASVTFTAIEDCRVDYTVSWPAGPAAAPRKIESAPSVVVRLFTGDGEPIRDWLSPEPDAALWGQARMCLRVGAPLQGSTYAEVTACHNVKPLRVPFAFSGVPLVQGGGSSQTLPAPPSAGQAGLDPKLAVQPAPAAAADGLSLFPTYAASSLSDEVIPGGPEGKPRVNNRCQISLRLRLDAGQAFRPEDYTGFSDLIQLTALTDEQGRDLLGGNAAVVTSKLDCTYVGLNGQAPVVENAFVQAEIHLPPQPAPIRGIRQMKGFLVLPTEKQTRLTTIAKLRQQVQRPVDVGGGISVECTAIREKELDYTVRWPADQAMPSLGSGPHAHPVELRLLGPDGQRLRDHTGMPESGQEDIRPGILSLRVWSLDPLPADITAEVYLRERTGIPFEISNLEF